MFRPSAHSTLAAAAMAVALALPGLAFAEPAAPLAMNPLYAEPAESASASAAAACPITIVELTDARRAPETLGMFAGIRSITAPADRAAWLHSIVEVGLGARGFSTTFAPAPVAVAAAEPAAAEVTEIAATPAVTETASDVLTVRVALRSVWLSTLGMNKAGSVMLHMSATRAGQSREGNYRGETTGPNWAGTRSEFNQMLDRTIAEALDAMANDLRPLCSGA